MDPEATIWQAITASNEAWRAGRPEDAAALFHPDVVMESADGRVLLRGRDAMARSYADYARQVVTHAFHARDHAVHVFGDAAVASYGFDVRYETGGQVVDEAGRERLLFVLRDGRWQAAWRTQTRLAVSAPAAASGGEASGVAGVPVERFHAAYAADGFAAWDIGAPQPALVALAEEGGVRGRVLDAGCGTGDNALMLAARGLDVTGVDFVEAAVAQARAKAAARGLAATFVVGDALHLEALALGRAFDTVVDSALFHVFDDAGRERYVASLARVVAPGGRAYVLCFNEHTPAGPGPRRVRQEEIRAAFAAGWQVAWIRAERYIDRIREGGAHAWLAAIDRTTD